MRHRYLAGPRGPVGWDEHGDGPPLVLLAGLGSTRAIWGELPRLLGRRFTVLAPDNRGVGSSRAGARFTLAGAVDDLLILLDRRGLDRVRLLGASMGGSVAVLTALEAPERVSRLVACSCAGHLSTHGRRVLEVLRDLLLYLPEERVGHALMTLAFAPPAHDSMPGFVRDVSALYGPDPADVPGALAQVEHLLGGWDLRPRLGRLALPTLVVAGLRDPVVAPEDTAELALGIPGAELLDLANAAHSVLAEGGGALLDRVAEFLAAAP